MEEFVDVDFVELPNDEEKGLGRKLSSDGANVTQGVGLATVSESVLDATRNELLPEPSSSRRQGEIQNAAFQANRLDTSRLFHHPLMWVIVLGVAITILIMIVLVCLYVWAVFATLYYFADPCDEPLKWYVIITLNHPYMLHILFKINKYCEDRGWASIASSRLNKWWLRALVALLLLLWGVCLVCGCDTCQVTNPPLYTAVLWWVSVRVVMNIFLLFCIALVIYYRHEVSAFLEAMTASPGCVDSIRNLPKISPNSPALLDPEDGLFLRCAICAEALGGAEIAVKTMCSHFFHEECLVRWCKDHIHCPLCRRRLNTDSV